VAVGEVSTLESLERSSSEAKIELWYSCWQQDMDMDRKCISAVKKVQMKDGSAQSFYFVKIFVRSEHFAFGQQSRLFDETQTDVPAHKGKLQTLHIGFAQPRMNDVDVFFYFGCFLLRNVLCLWRDTNRCAQAGKVQTVT
jgi:hypothetical protein